MEKNILSKSYEIFQNASSASLEDITSLLNYYNGQPVLFDGISYHPFNDPVTAAKLNTRYRELTGQDHPTFVEQAPTVIEGLMRDKDMLLEAEAYTPEYFEALEQIRASLGGLENQSKQK